MSAKPVCPKCHYWIINRHLEGSLSCSNCGWMNEPPPWPPRRVPISHCPKCGTFTLICNDNVWCARCNWIVRAETHLAQEPITEIPIDIC